MANVTKQASARFSIVKRSKKQSVVEKTSYISRKVLVSEYDGQTYRPKCHEDLVHSEIIFPPNAPKEYADRSILWNAVEVSENRKAADDGGAPLARRKGSVVVQHGEEYPHEQKVQRGRAPVESVHVGFSLQKEKSE